MFIFIISLWKNFEEGFAGKEGEGGGQPLPPFPPPPLLLLDAAATGGRATELRGARGRPRGPAESCRRGELLPAPLAGHQTRLAGAEGARRCLCAYTLMQAALPPGRQWRWSAPFPPPCARGRVPGMGGHHQRPGLRQGAVISDAHPSRTTGHPSLARRGAVCRHGGERRATSAARARPVPWDPRPEIDALFSSCEPPWRPARARLANPFPEWGLRGPSALPSGAVMWDAYEIPPPGHLGSGAAARVGGIERGTHVNA